MIIFMAQDILASSHCKLGHFTSLLVHYYIELDIYTSLEVHTEDTIAAGKFGAAKVLRNNGLSHVLFKRS